MNVAIVVQARMSSRRLPGKVLRPILGQPMLGWLLDRLEHCPERLPLLVATSVGPDDAAIARYCEQRGVPCFRGDLHDVASRFAAVVERHSLDAFIRVCGDSPLFDQRLVGRALQLFRQERADLVTNVFPRSYPRGQSVEVVSGPAFARARALMMSPADREHVTAVLYRHPEAFAIRNFAAPSTGWGDAYLAVDSEEHLRVVEAIARRMARPPWEYSVAEMVELHRAVVAGAGREAA